jgi:membrane-associated protein
VRQLINFFLHIDKHLEHLLATYGKETYIIFFAIIFIETGIVIMPFLPGDSLLFAVGVSKFLDVKETVSI